ncbi:hypothetical protein [Streptomyces sp. NPDC001410]|uniref:hypothetical protein n=1 Tax=Streptomyces sp. NPDC001410 TaxID=3364574 RepID=UPI00368BB594
MAPKDGKVEVRQDQLKQLRQAELPAVLSEAQRIWTEGLQPPVIRIRRSYYRNAVMETVLDERKPLPREKRPPSARMIAPKGLTLKLHLTLLFAAQCAAAPNKPWRDVFPIEPTAESSSSWMALVPTVAKYHGPGIQVASEVTNKRRQLTQALKKLEESGLVRPSAGPGRSRKGFMLLHENAKSTAAAPIEYTVPGDADPFLAVPVELFTQGWVHVLTTSEIAALLMWLDALQFFGMKLDNGVIVAAVASDIRAGHYGLGRETYETHQQLDAFGLLDVVRPWQRHADGKWFGYSDDSDLRCHRVALGPEGFNRDAADVVAKVLARRDTRGDWSREPNAPRNSF